MTWIEIQIHIEDFILITIIPLPVTRVLVQEKNVGWIFVQNAMQMDLDQYKVLHMIFEQIRI
jgi:hypothetical protein